ncbi:MAG: hypothetical protein LBC51_01240 [Treponema sp.]|nr:hypothetical protein [Treponema sp.]
MKTLSPRIIDFTQLEQHSSPYGIDGKDVQEIQAHIDTLSRKNRITLSSKELKITPTKNAVVFPLVVNTLMWGIAAGALLLVGQGLTRDKARSGYEQGFSSVEGELIQQIRQDSQVRLSEKEQEIEAIRKQLADIKTEERNAANKFQELYTQREQELQTSLDKDMADERQRLISTGVSTENMKALLAAYEQERFAYYRAELDRYQAQLEVEREAARANYQQLQNKYQQDLRSLNEERQIIKETLIQQETQLRLVRETSTPLEVTSIPEWNAALEEAKNKLVVLQEQQQQALQRDNRIIGMYHIIRTNLEQEHYRDALVQAESLVQYLGESPPDRFSSQRHSLDIYLAGALAWIARTELTRSEELSPKISDLETQIAILSSDNERLTKVSQELSQALVDQDLTWKTEMSASDARIALLSTDKADMEARIAFLSRDNERLTQANQELTQALAALDRSRTTDKADMEARIALLSRDNERLTQANQELTQTLAALDRSRTTDKADMEARIAFLSGEHARLTQANQELSQALLAEQNQRLPAEYQSKLTALEEDNRRLNQRIAEQVTALAQVTDEVNKTADPANAYIALTNAYTRYTATPGRISDMEYFFDTPEVDQTFPGFLDHLKDLNRQVSQDAYQEGIANAMGIIETALRIPQQDTRTKYLEGIRERYRSDPHISNLITLLLSRL